MGTVKRQKLRWHFGPSLVLFTDNLVICLCGEVINGIRLTLM
jgi:hypothetical protein